MREGVEKTGGREGGREEGRKGGWLVPSQHPTPPSLTALLDDGYCCDVFDDASHKWKSIVTKITDRQSD